MSEFFIPFVIITILLFAVVVFVFNLSLRKLVKKKTEELQKEKNFLNYAMESTNTNLNITDSDYNLKYVDPGWIKVYGDPTGRKCFEYFMGQDKPCEVCGMPEAMKKKKIIVYEEVMPKENNRVVEVHTIPFREPDGKWLFAEFNVDITKRKKAEEALQNAQRLESLGILAGGIAHDFNNLLAGIFGNISIASEIVNESEASEYLLKASGAINRAKGLTSQLLTFAKGGDPVKKTEHLSPFIEETVKFALSGSKILCKFEISKDLSFCKFDRNQIGQVIDNLVINAKQAMPETGKIKVSAKNTVISGDEKKKRSFGKYIKITITDNGAGISKENLPKIFDPFFTTKVKGAGLGLATSFSIIKRHGGWIDVETELGRGSSFAIFLPAATGTPDKDVKKIEIKHKGSGTFLVMDDQKLISTMVAKMLENLGYSTVCKEDGEAAVKFFAENASSVKAMLFDLTIPGGMGGVEAISKVREIDKEVPVFVSSGYADDPAMSNPEKFGFTASLSKPFKKEDLIIILDKHLK